MLFAPHGVVSNVTHSLIRKHANLKFNFLHDTMDHGPHILNLYFINMGYVRKYAILSEACQKLPNFYYMVNENNFPMIDTQKIWMFLKK